jgi:hypothetical protein
VEGRELGHPVELLEGRLDLLGLGGGVGRSPELAELLLELGLVSELVESLGEVDTLLTGGLGGRGVLRSRAVTEGVHAVRAEHRHVVVDEETSALSLSLGELGHEVARDCARGVSRGPYKETVRNLLDLLVRVLDDNRFLLDVLDHGAGEDINLVLLEGGLGVLDELLGERGEHVGQRLDQGDLQSVGDFRVPLLQVVLKSTREPGFAWPPSASDACQEASTHDQEVVQLAGVLDTGRTTTDNNHVHKSVDLRLGLVLERGGFDA